ncbi:Glycosyl hydrolase family protein [Perilla frutescens var. frutescens]|nr:Glycosyl hydrolase family protein [Perilla frutescens var. frutescens]
MQRAAKSDPRDEVFLEIVTNLKEERSKKEKKKRRKNKEVEVPGVAETKEIDSGFKDFCGELFLVDDAKEKEKPEPDNVAAIVSEAVETDPAEVPDNAVLRKLLRGPRYFDPPDNSWGACYNCGEEGHTSVNCTSARRKKPCFVCGSFEHNAKQCSKGRDCFICKQQGHRAKDCPEKYKTSKICLKCGDLGHEMFMCRNDYCPDDLKEIQCYICGTYGHLCCKGYTDPGPREVSCYRCGHSGHTGLACSGSRWDTTNDMVHTTVTATASSCYKCSIVGHFARECTSSMKASKRNREPSTPKHKSPKKKRDQLESRSAPHDIGKTRKKKKHQSIEFSSPVKPKHRGGWITEDPEDYYTSKSKDNYWRSPATPRDRKARNPYSNGGDYASSSYSSKNPRKINFHDSPSNGSNRYHQRRYSASRFGNNSNGGAGRNNEWWECDKWSRESPISEGFRRGMGEYGERDPSLVKRIGAATAIETRATAIHYDFAPGLAVCRDPRWGQCYESYSEDTKIVRAMTEIVPGLQGDIPPGSKKGVPFLAGKTKVAACAKYYVGDGGTTNGTDKGNTVIDSHELLSIHMPPYVDSIRKGVASIMVGYSSWNGKKMHVNHDLVTGFLKEKLKFKGFVISGWAGVAKITNPPHINYSSSVQASILAGIDIVMLPDIFTDFVDDLTFQVKNGIIPMSRIDDAVRRVLRVKFTMGLFENPFTDLSLVNELGSQEHRKLATEAVRRSLVLLKNGKRANQPLLPLEKKVKKVLVAGTHADNFGYQCGGFTVDWQGVTGNNLILGTTILNAIKNTVDPSTQVVHIENPNADLVKSHEFSYAIVVVGEPAYAEEGGDSKNLTIIEPGPSTIRNVCGVVRCVVVVVSGRPLTIKPYVDQIDALVAAWLPGTEGQGVADVLFGDYGFTGKLPITWFKSVDQLPMNVGDPHYDPLFPFGFGLTTKPRQGI